MDKTRQAISLTVIILSAVFLVISLAGIILTWSAYQRLDDDLMGRVDAIEADLRSAQGDLQMVKSELDAVQEQIDALQAALEVLGVDGAASLEGVAALIGRLEGTLTPFISGVAERVEDLRDAVVRLKDTIDTLTTGFAGLEGSAQTLSAALGGYDALISGYLEKIDGLQANLPRWSIMAAISLTLVFVWLGFSQAALILLAWSFYRGEDLLARWRT